MAGSMRWYVYALVDPSTGDPFYIGKGSGKRMLAHGQKADVGNRAKIAMIKAIGYHNVIRREIAYFYKEHDAYLYEGKLIRSFSGLTNIKGGTTRQVPVVTFFGLFFAFIRARTAATANRFLVNFQQAKHFSVEHRELINIVERFIESKTKVINYAKT